MIFKICRHCGNMVGVLQDSGVPMVCCGEPMKALNPNTVEASGEKHVPVVRVEGSQVTVDVGSVTHPMLPEHFIQWVAVETDKGMHRRNLQAGEGPKATFQLGEEKPLAVYAYCNLHGLWKTDI